MDLLKKNQSSYYKKNIDFSNQYESSTAVIHVDFAENYKCQFQDEPQAAHFGQNQVTLMTVAIYHRNAFKKLAIVVDTNNHDKNTVVPMLDLIISQLSSTVKRINFWSDNATSHFKNKYVIASLKYFIQKYNINMSWSFFAAQHGKGVVDGIGATIKKLVWSKVKCRQLTVTNAKEFADACVNSKTQVQLKYIFLLNVSLILFIT